MEWVVTSLYIMGALITHYLIYKRVNEEILQEKLDHQTANITCILWPIALMLYVLLTIEQFFGRKFN